jgi:hypothetical protein
MADYSAASIIDEKGGPAVFAELVGKSAGAVRVWKHRNQIPRDSWPEIIKAFPDITLDRLCASEPDLARAGLGDHSQSPPNNKKLGTRP